jgi:glycosyltransferase involved in cell wall biosynthesis
MKFSVLITTHAGEKAENLDKSLSSIYESQTLKPEQIILVLDGPVGSCLEEIVLKYLTQYPEVFTVVRLPENAGQGLASMEGMKYCRCDLVARMDSDDISCPDRFALQIEAFARMPEIDVVGGWIKEFSGDGAELIRKLPENHREIEKAFRYKNPVNNVSAMFRRVCLDKIGGYTAERNGEDYKTYAKMLVAGCKFYNIPQVLVHVRAGENMLKRRGSANVFKSWVKNQRILLRGGKTNAFHFAVSCAACFAFVKTPPQIKKLLYGTFLRSKPGGKEKTEKKPVAERKKVGLVSIYTGYNYGSILQAYAMNELIRICGYEPYMMWHKGGIVKGRDVRFGKMLHIFFRTAFRPKLMRKIFLTYSESIRREMHHGTKEMFLDFAKNNFDVHKLSFPQMKAKSRSAGFAAVVSGSAQVWNAEAAYISPFYYLRFVPQSKRVAYAPSIGRDSVPDYNRKILRKYISEFAHVSIRETQGADIIEDLTGKRPEVTLDPTLAVDGQFWHRSFVRGEPKPKEHIVFYFLDEPCDAVTDKLKEIAEHYACRKIIALPYAFGRLKNVGGVEFAGAGPAEFIDLIAGAAYLCTDSFHGIAFAISLNIPFVAFERNYGVASDQSSRIKSILSILGIENRYLKDASVFGSEFYECDFTQVNALLEKERVKSVNYLRNALQNCERSQK